MSETTPQSTTHRLTVRHLVEAGREDIESAVSGGLLDSSTAPPATRRTGPPNVWRNPLNEPARRQNAHRPWSPPPHPAVLAVGTRGEGILQDSIWRPRGCAPLSAPSALSRRFRPPQAQRVDYLRLAPHDIRPDRHPQRGSHRRLCRRRWRRQRLSNRAGKEVRAPFLTSPRVRVYFPYANRC
jgi:hypothetical protein